MLHPITSSHYPGGKGRSFRELINLMPPHDRYIETHLGAGAVLRNKRPARSTIGIEIDPLVIGRWQQPDIPNLKVIAGDAIEILPRLGLGPGDLIYCDPPYLPAVRRQRRCYRHDYTEHDHHCLLDLLTAVPCDVVLSGYRSDLYDERLASWTRTDYDAQTHRGVVIESAWTNFVPAPPLHDYSHIGADFRERERFKRRTAGLARKIRRADPLELHAALVHVADSHPEAVRAAAERIQS